MASTRSAQVGLRRRRRAVFLAVVAAALLVGCGSSSDETTTATTSPPGTLASDGAATTGPGLATNGLVSFSTGLTGAAEVPGPGDPDGVGSAVVTLNPGRSELCFEITVAYIDRPDAAHIHSGAAGETGPPVVTLAPLKVRSSNGCIPVNTDVIEQIKANPQGHYVNLHNPAFPEGAMRGQLAR